jgi:hypothetical protein
MGSETDLLSYEIVEKKPEWLDVNFPNDDEYMEVRDIVKFYLINNICENSSCRGTDIDKWGKTSSVLLDKIKDILQLKKGKNYDYCTSIKSIKNLYQDNNLGNDFTFIKENKILFLKNNTVIDSIFRHIRNAIAHSRWQIIGNYYYFEDVKLQNINGKEYWVSTARIILKKESLIECKNIILNGPDKEDLDKINLDKRIEEMIIELIKNFYEMKRFGKGDAIALLKIDDNVWQKLCKKGKEKGVMKFNKPNWNFTEKAKDYVE